MRNTAKKKLFSFADNVNEQEIVFAKKEAVSGFRIKSVSAYDNDQETSIAEINILGVCSL